jgi:hypothetical protein
MAGRASSLYMMLLFLELEAAGALENDLAN